MKLFGRIKDHDLVKEIDRGVKIKFNFAWMDDVINYEDRFVVQNSIRWIIPQNGNIFLQLRTGREG